MAQPSLLLASASPRRRELLAAAGYHFRVCPADVDETVLPGEMPEAYVLRLAEAKARAILAEAAPDELVVASDTTVVAGQLILGKPSGPAEAVEMLRRLRGGVHQVDTGVAVLRPAGGALETGVCVTDVTMRAYTDLEIEDYVASGDPLDKAGAYAIQHAGFHPVSQIYGCYASVMGLPLCTLARLLARFGFRPGEDIPLPCDLDPTRPCVYVRQYFKESESRD